MIFDNQIMTLFSLDVFRQIACDQNVTLAKLNILMTMLINYNIPFELSFSEGTRSDAPAAELTITINPTTTMVFVIGLDPGTNAFTSTQ